MKNASDDQTVQAYVEGRREAYDLVNRWVRMIVDSRHWGLSHQREDILQEVHRRLFENLSQGRFRSRSSLKTYVLQVSKYTCIEFLRKKIRVGAVGLDAVELRDDRPGPEQRLASSEWTAVAKEALASLPESCRQLFQMIFAEHLPYQDISRKLGIAEGTVKSRTWRCREQLAILLKTKGFLHPP